MGLQSTNNHEVISEPVCVDLSQAASVKKPRIVQQKSMHDCDGGSGEAQLVVSLDITKFQVSGRPHYSHAHDYLVNTQIQSRQVHSHSVEVQTSQSATINQGSQTEPQEPKLCTRCQTMTDEGAHTSMELPLEKKDIQWDKTAVNWKKGLASQHSIKENTSIAVHGYDVCIVDSTVGSLCVYDSRKDKWLPYSYECPCLDFQPAIVRDTLVLVSNGIPGDTTTIHTLDLTRNRLWDNAYSSIPLCVSNPKVASTAPYLIIASTMPNAAHVYILNMHSEKWYYCDKHCLPSWISSISAIATDGETLYIAPHKGSVTACSLSDLINVLITKGPVRPLLNWNRLPFYDELHAVTSMTTLYGYLVAVVAKTLLIYDRKKGSWMKSIIPLSYNSSKVTAISTLPDGKLIAFAEKHPLIGTISCINEF